MMRHDAVLVGPSPAGVRGALRAAGAAADGRARLRLLGWPLDGLDDFLTRLAGDAEGYREWVAGPVTERLAPRSRVAAAWWRDFAGRTHLRIVSRRDRLCGNEPFGLFGVPRNWPPLALVHPTTTLLCSAGEGAGRLVVLCPCGVWGPPASVGWMGRQCGPCHDRAASGLPVPADWSLPPPAGRFAPYVVLSSDGATVAQFDPCGPLASRSAWRQQSPKTAPA
jgi:hypothetical protein